jgi:hypothetical protein
MKTNIMDQMIKCRNAVELWRESVAFNIVLLRALNNPQPRYVSGAGPDARSVSAKSMNPHRLSPNQTAMPAA